MSEETSKSGSGTTFSETKEKMSKVLEENMPQDLEEVKKIAGALAEDAANFVKKYPLPSLMGALALGFLIGSSFGRKKSE